MTNRSSSKQHGLVGNNRPVAKLRKKKNKYKAKLRREERMSQE